jgi:hypothetical protein
MKALKSKLADQILRSGVRVPLSDGSNFVFGGIKYVVKIVPKAARNSA